MAFDDKTRKGLNDFVAEARRALAEEFTRQLQNDYGLDPSSGYITPLEKLGHLDDARMNTALVLREITSHYQATMPDGDVATVLDRLVREQAFTTLNRLVALRMMEARGLLIESVGNGYQSQGFQLYSGLAGSGLGELGDAYCAYLFSLFDEFSLELPSLFDRHAPLGRLFPRTPALLQVLGYINAADVVPLWAEDETIGWIYQYFNSRDERKKMRDASQAPRNSRELAVRNQFFTPRYVVEFLVDNTLGRTWYEMTQSQTELAERCRYLLRTPNDVFLPKGQAKQEEHEISFRSVKDPREIRLLDPACGSMHFGLYAFDLFEVLYKEAWERDDLARPEGMRSLREAYPDEDAFHRDIPRLIIEHNLYGVDIDPRAAQIAALALWLRAQRAWHEAGVKARVRPRIQRSNVVPAVAPPTEKELRDAFAAGLDYRDAELFEKTLVLLKGLPELGVLLRIEKELPSLIKHVFGSHGPMFREGDTEAWSAAEDRLRKALEAFAHAARSGFQARLFAHDALQGLKLIDITREKFDVVVMNPPFGAVSYNTKYGLNEAYPNSNNDLLGIFVERGLELLHQQGHLGAITSRTCFYLTSFSNWRQKTVLKNSAFSVIADLGQGVMDEAMVEAAAYVLEKGSFRMTVPVVRAISDENRTEVLDACLSAYRNGHDSPHLFNAEFKTFEMLPDSPFVYWVDSKAIALFACKKHFEPDVGVVRQGLATGDDPRFVRAIWEVKPEDTLFCYYPTSKDEFCRFDDPAVEAYMRRRHIGRPTWAFHVKAGASQPWHSPITLKVNWKDNGYELKNFKDAKGKVRSRPQNISYYYRPGFSWTRRAVRFYPYIIPCNCIPSVSRYMAFPDYGMYGEALGISASRLASAFMRFYAEFWQRPNFLVDTVKMLPWPNISEQGKTYFSELIVRKVESRRQAYQNHEPFHEFCLPAKIHDFSSGHDALDFDQISLIGEEGERYVAEAYGFTFEQTASVERDLREAIAYQCGYRNEASEQDEDLDVEEDSDFILDTSFKSNEESHISYLIGCAFGRWDIRLSTGEKSISALPDPFSPLPACPPGMLQNALGLPACSDDVSVDYPVKIAWAGVLVDDDEHPQDIVKAIRFSLKVVWRENADLEEERACAALSVNSLREYLRRPSGFFFDHLKRYSKSSRKAPIYWPLTTASGSYTLWLYYPSLSSQTLYTALNDFVEPKLLDVNKVLSSLRDKGSARSSTENKELAALQDLEIELVEFRDTLISLAPRYRPNQDDGVQISAAPLWPLFRHKPWQKVLKDTFEKLKKGDFDWANLAMNYWPERVREKCKTDKSLAIAHGLEALYVEPPANDKPKRGRKAAAS